MNKRFKAPNCGWFKPCFFLDYAFTPLTDFKLYKLEKLFYITIENHKFELHNCFFPQIDLIQRRHFTYNK